MNNDARNITSIVKTRVSATLKWNKAKKRERRGKGEGREIRFTGTIKHKTTDNCMRYSFNTNVRGVCTIQQPQIEGLGQQAWHEDRPCDCICLYSACGY